jgi:hypothetical protein
VHPSIQAIQKVFWRGIVLSALAQCAASPATAQTLKFFFVAPTGVMDTNFAGTAFTNADIPAGYKAVEVTATTLARFQTLAPRRIRHIHDQMQAGTTLRGRIDRVLQISGGKVDVSYYLADDRTGFPGSLGGFSRFVPNTTTGLVHAWPAANNPVARAGTDRFDCWIGLGEVGGELISTSPRLPGGLLAWEGVALHETSHSQFVGAWSKWGSINQRAITYGEDGGHYREELIGDQSAAFDEGHGNFYGYLHNDAGRREQIDWFKRTDYRYFVEARSVLAGEPELYRVAARQPGTEGVNNEVDVFRYRWTDVPGYFLLFSESTVTMYHLLVWQETNNDRDQAFQMIVNASNKMWQTRMKRGLCYSASQVAIQLEDFAATPAGQAKRTAGTLTSSMYPFAVLDLVTHFGMTDADYQADCRRWMSAGERTPRALTEYFNHRARARSAAQAHLAASPIAIEAATTAIHRYFQGADTILTPAP